MAKHAYLIIEKSKDQDNLFIGVKKMGEEVIIPGSKFRFFVDNKTGIITNYETGLSAGRDINRLYQSDAEGIVQKHIDFYGLIHDWPVTGKQFYTVFTKYADDFKRIFGIDITEFRYSMLHCLGIESFNIVLFDEAFIKTRTELTGLSTQQATINKYGQEAGDLINKILKSEREAFGGLIL